MTKISRQRRNELRRDAHHVRRRGQADGQPVGEIADAILAELPELLPLEAWRLAYGWSRQQTIEAMASLPGTDQTEHTMPDPSMMCRWEHGVYQPSLRYARMLCAVYGTTPDRLGLSTDIAAPEPAMFCPDAGDPARAAADHGLDLPWHPTGLLKLLKGEDPMLSRREFGVISGTALTSHAWRALDTPALPLPMIAQGTGRISEPLIALIEDTVARAQQLDDRQGGGTALGWVTDQFHAVARLLRQTNHTPQTSLRLYTALAQLAQTAGFMAYESARDGQAQRWYLLGLRAAHAANDRGLQASVLSLMSNQAATRNNTSDAIQLATVAEQAATSAPARIRALIAARSGLAHATAGDLPGVRRSHETSLNQLVLAEHQPEIPPWASYATRTELAAISGRSLVILAERVPTRQSPLLVEAEDLLHARAFTDSPDAQRSALRHSAWLALAHTRAGELPQATTAARSALKRLPSVTSSGSVQLLHQVRAELATHASHEPRIRAFMNHLNQQLRPDDHGI